MTVLCGLCGYVSTVGPNLLRTFVDHGMYIIQVRCVCCSQTVSATVDRAMWRALWPARVAAEIAQDRVDRLVADFAASLEGLTTEALEEIR